MENDENKAKLRQIIKLELEETQSSLANVKTVIEEESGIKIRTVVDQQFIEGKYMEYSKMLVLEELRYFITNRLKHTSHGMAKILSELQEVSSLNDIPEPFRDLPYYKLLMRHIDLMSKEDEDNFAILVKNTCLQQIYSRMDDAKKELEFLERFKDFLSNTYCLANVLEKSQLSRFWGGQLCWRRLISDVLKLSSYHQTFPSLCDAARQLLHKEELYLKEIFQNQLEPFTRPIQIKEEGSMLRLSGMNLTLSEHKEDLEKKLEENPLIKEVYFVAERIFHIDADLTWHGKNIVCMAKVIAVRERSTWNVSGRDVNHVYTEEAGTETTGHGKDGNDGFAGESGGNITICAEEIRDANWLTLSSNGGNGSQGQEGGKGRDGEDGKALEFDAFKERFPTTAYFAGYKRINKLKKLYEVFDRDLSTKREWYVSKRQDFYVEGTTSEGNRIKFSHTENSPTRTYGPQSVMLYKGALGRQGGNGGQCGLGGQGGYAGDLDLQIQNETTSNPILNNQPGQVGNDGLGGLYGKYGKNGWDVAWMDCAWDGGWPKFYGRDKNSTLEIKFYNNKSSERIYCKYKDKYAAIKSSRLEHAMMIKYEQRQRSSRQRNERQEQSKAIRQKPISGQTVKAEFKKIQQKNSINQNIINLRQEIKNIQQAALQDVVLNEETEVSQNFELKVTTHSRFAGGKNHNKTPRRTFVNAVNQRTPTDDLMELLIKLKNPTKDLLERCHLVLLWKVNQELPVYYPLEECPATELSSPRFLSKTQQDISETHTHRILGALKQYLHVDTETQRENLVKFCQQIGVKNCLKSALRLFVLEAGAADCADNELKKFYHLYQFHLKRRANGFLSFPEAIDKYAVSNSNVFKCFLAYLHENGRESPVYLEVLAQLYEINIKLYYEVNDQDYELLNELNPKATKVLYLTHKFEHLLVKPELLQLMAERRYKSQQYQKILMDVRKYENSSDFLDYLTKGMFPQGQEEYGEVEFTDEEELVQSLADNFPSHFPMANRLSKLKYFYSGQRGIIHYMENRFAHNAIRVTASELDYIVNYTLKYSAENDSNDTEFFLTWIFGAFDQSNWLDEIILLELEEFFGEQLVNKSQLRGYLNKIGGKDILIRFGQQLAVEPHDRLTQATVEHILCLLSKLPNQELSLDQLELTNWPYVLSGVYLTNTLNQIAFLANDDELQRLSYYVLNIENVFGHHFTQRLLSALKERMNCREDLRYMSNMQQLDDMLKHISAQSWLLTEDQLQDLENPSIRLANWAGSMHHVYVTDLQNRSLEQLILMLQRNENNSPNILDLLPGLSHILYRSTVLDPQPSLPHFKHAQKLEQIDEVIREKRKFGLRDTQKLTILLLLDNQRSTLAQVSTGEGKTLIVVVASLIKALENERVDIVTSSSVLAKRDAELNRDIYQRFGITVSHNCSEDLDLRKHAYASSTVVYGELSNFQRDYLLDNFYGKNILGKRCFDQVNVIVDEVDSMLLDKGNNMLYLSHDLPNMDKLESVYIFIWSRMNRVAAQGKRCNHLEIREAVLKDLFGLITEMDLNRIDPNFSQPQIRTLKKCLVSGKIIDRTGKLQVESINESQVSHILPDEWTEYTHRLLYLIKACLKRPRRIHLPNYLRDFVERHLDAWIKSALLAFVMQKDVDYVVDVDRTGAASSSRSPQIIILDRDTGTDQTSSQWDEGLHQFMQLKHNCRITLQSLKAVFISNVSFFKLYKRLYGLTGTLGSQTERDILKQMHEVDFFTMPTARVKRMEELQPIVCKDSDEWAKSIQEETQQMLRSQRSVLIITDSVRDAEILYHGMKDDHVRLYTREFDEFDIVKGTENLGTGQVIIATNLAGRGTDIKPSDELRRNGGLHVILIYMAKNERIEEQANGRTGRCGDKGSVRLIIVDPNMLNIYRLKKERNQEEIRRLAEIKQLYDNPIKLEEHCFKKFKETYAELENIVNHLFDHKWKHQMKQYSGDTKAWINDNHTEGTTDPELRAILMDACLEKWAFWLDNNAQQIENCIKMENRQKVYKSLDAFLNEMKDLKAKPLEEWVYNSPIQTVKLGLHLARKMNLTNEAIALFNRVIGKEPAFSDAAHYYKAFVQFKNGKVEEFKKELRFTQSLLNRHSTMAQLNAALVENLRAQNKDSILQIDAYKEQQAALAHIYELIANSIQSIFGQAVTLESFTENNIPLDEAHDIFEKLIGKGILTRPQVETFNEETVDRISLEYLNGNLKQFLTQYQKITSEKDFRHELKKQMVLPSRELFLKNLMDQEILFNVKKYVSFDLDVVKSLNSDLVPSLEKLKPVQFSEESVWLSYSKPDENTLLYCRNELKRVLSELQYDWLKQAKALSFYHSAEVNEELIANVKFDLFNSLRREDFQKVNILPEDADKILLALVKNDIVRCHPDGVYRLSKSFEELDHMRVIPDYPIYESAVNNLLKISFLFRNEWERFKSQLPLTGGQHLKVGLMSKPHNNLLIELIQEGILLPTRVANLKDFEAKLNEMYPKEGCLSMLKNALVEIINKGIKLTNEALDTKLFEMYPTNDKKHQERNLMIHNLLISARSTLESLETPDGTLKHLTATSSKENLGMALEFYLFSLNGFDQLLELAEQKWSRAMISRTTIIISIGILQTALGAGLQLQFPVAGTSLLRQGFRDLLFAITSALGGHLTWGDYRQHKIFSLVVDAVFHGLGGACKSISTISKDSLNLAANIAGKEVLEVATEKPFAQEMVNKIVMSAGKAIENLMWINVVSQAIDMCLRNFWHKMSDTFCAAMCSELDKHDALVVFGQIFDCMGAESGHKFVVSTTKTFLKDQRSNSELILKLMQAGQTLMQQLPAISKIKASGTYANVVKALTIILQGLEYGAIIVIIVQLAQTYISHLKAKLEEGQNNENCGPPTQESLQLAENERTQAKKILQKEMKDMFYDKVGKTLIAHGTIAFKNYMVKQAKDFLCTPKKDNYSQDIQEANQTYQKASSHSLSERDQLDETYNKNLKKLMNKSRSPVLTASVVRENVAMDMICVKAAVYVVANLLRSSVKLVVEAENDLRREANSGGSGPAREIQIKFSDNHFDSADQSQGNDCLYHSLPDDVKQKITPQEFRNQVANVIQSHPLLGNYIRVNSIFDSDSTEFDERNELCNMRLRNRRVIPEKVTTDLIHLKFTSYKFYKLLDDISRQSGIPKEELIEAGGSQFQGGHSKNQKYPKSHVIQMGSINSRLDEFPELKKKLMEYVAHTQIDNAQAKMHEFMCQLDFCKNYEQNERKLIYVSVFYQSHEMQRDNPKTLRSIRHAREYVQNIDLINKFMELKNRTRRNSF